MSPNTDPQWTSDSPHGQHPPIVGITLPEVLGALVVAGLSTGFRFGQQALAARANETSVENQARS